MSRRDFRKSVESPRPRAAWIMSLVASACLWVTEQIPYWMMAVQLVAFAASYWTREDPPSFRRSPVWLNIFMAGITTITIRSALDGNPATISLAYFTALAQGLQLLDARPRKSEFVLVALSLFQVILASNLTDSVFFPPLLVVFLVAVTWTLLVHTLAMEAAESGDPNAGRLAVTSDLRRVTALATLVCLVLAAVLFISLPRLRTNLLRGGIGTGIPLSGFSTRVALGDVGRIRKDPTVVLRVEALEGDLPEPARAYWRGLAFDHFDGTNWSVSSVDGMADRKPISGIGRFGIELSPDARPVESAQRILREPVESGVLFNPGTIRRIAGPFQRLERDRNGGLYLPGRGDERVRYSIWTADSERDATRLRRDRSRPPLEPGPGGPRPATRYLQLPPLDARVALRARTLVTDAATDFDRAIALRDDLRERGRYTDSPPPLGDATTSPIEAFLLGDQEGHCEYFASAMVVLARSAGLPSRLVNGFAGGVRNEVGNFLEVSRADAHAWVEIHFESAGWVRFDPTPVALRLRAENDLTVWQRLAQLGSAVELWWFQRVVDFDSADQIGAVRGLLRSFQRNGDEQNTGPGDAPRSRHPWANPLRDIDPLVVFGIFVAALVCLAALRSWRRDPSTQAIPAHYREAQRLLAKRGVVRNPTTSAREFVRVVEARLDVDGAHAFARITESYLATRFGGRPDADRARDLTTLQDAIDRMGLGNQAHVG